MSPKPRFPQTHYTVGWVAALAPERAAAAGMLEKEHDPPTDFRKVPNDHNEYDWGRIGDHYVVIASLPAGMTGKVSTATTASFMLATFPSIRIGLMVGIGAGVTQNARNMCLGDVAVSQPDGASGGVIQYDLGKLTSEGFKRTGYLNAPPQAILSALSSLQARHERKRPKITEYVDQMLAANELMGEEDNYGYSFKRPDPSTDPRGKKPSRPKVFYGVIASGDKDIKDAGSRDILLKDAGERCICFEMEAAGLMNTFPCLVIRGISDYGDSDKNDVWQKYAAATAAAYAKEFLGTILASEVEKTPTATDRMKDLDSQPNGGPGVTNPNSVLKSELNTRPEQIGDIVGELGAPKSSVENEGLGRQRIDCGHDTVERKQDGSGTIIKFREPFSRAPVVTLTLRAIRSSPYDGQRVYLLQDQSQSASTTTTHFVVGCWGGQNEGVGSILEFDWIAVEPVG